MAAAPAMASKARVSALANSRQLVDVQYTFERPYLLHSVGELVTVEWGQSGDGAAKEPHAEGGLIKKHGESVYGIYFGRKSADFNTAVRTASGAPLNFTVLEEQNPMNLFYGMKSGDLSWGATLKYSNGKDDSKKQKATSMGIAAGVTNGTWEAELVLGLAGKTEEEIAGVTHTVESKGNTKLGFGYNLSDSMHAYADYKMSKIEGDTSAVAGVEATVEKTNLNVGFINTVAKNDDANVFYGVAYSMETIKDDSETTALPVWVGIEANATSWMVMRGSIKQNVLLNTTKDKTPGGAGDATDLDSVVAAAGVGIKLNKGMLDATFTQAGAGTINSDQLLSNVSYTYNF
ncbi:hypothetical protein [Bdellovibrio sp.]|uniref:hypothetical protein n=1 Tax=Bdellovibrio sp. TaxID=28201 RepID=UPI0039E48BF9